jgi:hypothetical protein
MKIARRKDRSQGLPNINQIVFPFQRERLNANIKLTLMKSLIRSVMTYASSAWELQLLQNRVLHTSRNFSRLTSVRDLHVAFQIPYVYDYITKLCRQQAEVIPNHDNVNVRTLEKRSPS